MELKNKKIIIFEDNPIWLKTLYLWFRYFGFRDITCSGIENNTYEFCKYNYLEVDVIIINFYNGRKNTTDLIRKLRKLNNNFLIIVISADFINDYEVLDTKEMMKAMTAGATRVCIKDINKLKDVVIEHLNIRESNIFQELCDQTKTYYNLEDNNSDE
jgi:DNA-binding response OmpR family regulator